MTKIKLFKRFAFSLFILPVLLTAQEDKVLLQESPKVTRSVFHQLSLVKNEGKTILERFDLPRNYKRVTVEERSFAQYLRNYPLRNPGSDVHLCNGRASDNQNSHCAVFDMTLKSSHQGSAQTILRLCSDYLYKFGRYKEIAFHLANGKVSRWSEWKKDFRLDLAGSLKKWTIFENPPDEKKCYDDYLKDLFINTDKNSLEIFESEAVTYDNVKIGDILLDIGNENEVYMVVDICINQKDYTKALLLATSTSSPASDFYIVNNPKRTDNPWYYEEDMLLEIKTPDHTFRTDCWRKLTKKY